MKSELKSKVTNVIFFWRRKSNRTVTKMNREIETDSANASGSATVTAAANDQILAHEHQN